MEAQVAAEQATTTKKAGLDELDTAMKVDLRYAENTVRFDNDKLILIGSVRNARAYSVYQRADLFIIL